MSKGNNLFVYFGFVILAIFVYIILSSSPDATNDAPKEYTAPPVSGISQEYIAPPTNDAPKESTGRAYQSYPNTDYGGGDLGLQTSQSVESCKELCDTNSTCVGFVYDIPNNQCYLKNSNINASPNPYNPNMTYYYTGSAPAGGQSLLGTAVTCNADSSWTPSGTIQVGGVISQNCPNGGKTTATCGSNGGWTFTSCSSTGKNIKWGANNNKCIAVHDGLNARGSNGTPLVLWDCSDDPNQRFTTDNNKIKWVNNNSITNKCVALSDGMNRRGANDTQFVLWDCGDDPNQHFGFYGNQIKWENASDNTHINNVCMSVSNGIGNGGANDTRITAWNCGDDPNQRFSY